MFAEPFTDWRFPESLVPHGDGEVLLGQMSFALIADVLVFPQGKFTKTGKLKIVELPSVDRAAQARPRIMFTGCASCVSNLMKWAIKYKASNVSLLTRDDEEIGRHQLGIWHSFTHKQHLISSNLLGNWYIMNSNMNEKVKGVHTVPLGVKFPAGYRNGMEIVEREGSSLNRSRLVTCSSMKFSYPDRIAMRNDLERNGINCHEGLEFSNAHSTRPSISSPTKLSKKSGRSQQDAYVRLLRSSYFFASPRGNGRDCYRHIEGVVAGSILLSRSLPHQDMEKFRGLPAVFFKDWKEITPKRLSQLRQDIYNNSSAYNLARAYFPWWLGAFLFPAMAETFAF